MASLTANEEHLAGGMQVNKISSGLFVNVSALYEWGPRPSFANYYHYDVDEANELRKSTARGAQLERGLLVDVDHCLRGNNEYCEMYMRFHEVLQSALHSREEEGGGNNRSFVCAWSMWQPLPIRETCILGVSFLPLLDRLWPSLVEETTEHRQIHALVEHGFTRRILVIRALFHFGVRMRVLCYFPCSCRMGSVFTRAVSL
ncbi:unnamed protein product [Toxocara canis]|uniref:Uncharacterized protein n=1 Tax=Toxocara canis TaxID=6265 RepID=A0A183U3J0_TOXCA|nr:unnamed protein product [Toxocara canis]